MKLEKQQTGIAAEYYAAAELSRLGFDVTITFGNTKSIDLLVYKEGETYAVQVKGIQATKSICWNLDKTKISTRKVILLLINLHIDQPEAKPEFFLMTSKEALGLFTDTSKQGQSRTYLDYKKLKNLKSFENRWTIFNSEQKLDYLILWKNI